MNQLVGLFHQFVGRRSPHLRRLSGPAAIFLLLLLVLFSVWWTNRSPQLILQGKVPARLRTTATVVFDQFQESFEAQERCIGKVRVTFEQELRRPFLYQPGQVLVLIRLPTTVYRFEDSLIRALAHHIEIHCEDHEDFRPDFLLAQGLPVNTPWRGGRTRAESPSIQFSEAVVHRVFGPNRVDKDIVLETDTLRMLEWWALEE